MTPVEQANFDQERELVRYWRDKHYANLQVIFNLEQRVKELEAMRINLNDQIELKVKAKGIEILRTHWSVNVPDIEKTLTTVYPKWKDGVVRMPIWEFAQIFGPHIGMGLETVVETSLELVGYTQ